MGKMTFRQLIVIATLGAAALAPPTVAMAQPPCTFSPTASMTPNGTPSEVFVQSFGDSGVRFEFMARAGRSYSVEVATVGDLYAGTFVSFAAMGPAACATTDDTSFTHDTSLVDPSPGT